MERSQSDDRLLPVPVPAAARAAVSPTALVLAGGGALAGLAVGLPVAAAVAAGACLWGIRVAGGAAVAAARSNLARRPERIDPYAVAEPWRSFVRESVAAQSHFDQAVARARPGPLQDRLRYVSVQVHDGVRECCRVAHLGAALDTDLALLDPEATSQELQRLQRTLTAPLSRDTEPHSGPRSSGSGDVRRPWAPDPPRPLANVGDPEAALAARLQAARRLQAAGQLARDRLQVLTAQLHTAVAGAVEVSLLGADPHRADELAIGVESVVGALEALRLAIEEAGRSTNPVAHWPDRSPT